MRRCSELGHEYIANAHHIVVREHVKQLPSESEIARLSPSAVRMDEWLLHAELALCGVLQQGGVLAISSKS